MLLLPKVFAQGSDNDMLSYENNDLGIRIQYPAEWTYSEGDPLTFRSPSEDATFTIRDVQIRDRVTGQINEMSIEQISNVIINQYASDPCLQLQGVTPNDDISVLIRMTCTTDEGEQIEEAIFIIRENNVDFLLTDFTANADVYNQYQDAWTSMIESVEFIDGNDGNGS